MKANIRSILSFLSIPLAVLGALYELIAIGFSIGKMAARRFVVDLVSPRAEREKAAKDEFDARVHALVKQYQAQYPGANVQVNRLPGGTVSVSVDMDVAKKAAENAGTPADIGSK